MPEHSSQEAADAHEARTALLAHVARMIEPLFAGPDMAEIATWLVELPTFEVARALDTRPEQVALNLAVALERQAAESLPDDAIAAIASRVAGVMSVDRLRRLVDYCRALRRLAIDTGDQVTTGQLYAEGFTAREQFLLKADAERVLKVLAGEGSTDPASPAERLQAAGRRAVRNAMAAA